MVTSIYGGAPSLRRFALEQIILAGGGVKLRGDFGDLPEPLPERWAERGYTRAGATFEAVDVEVAEVAGTPRLHLDSEHCLKGDPVELTVERAVRNRSAANEPLEEYVVLAGRGGDLAFRFVCKHLSVEVSGYTPAPY